MLRGLTLPIEVTFFDVKDILRAVVLLEDRALHPGHAHPPTTLHHRHMATTSPHAQLNSYEGVTSNQNTSRRTARFGLPISGWLPIRHGRWHHRFR
jgi:hypothetical protein